MEGLFSFLKNLTISKHHTLPIVFTMLVKICYVSIIVVLLRVCSTYNFLLPRFSVMRISKVLSILHDSQCGEFTAGLQLTWKSSVVKKSEQSKLKNLPRAKVFLQLHSNFQLFAIGLGAFHSGSITFLEITLVPNWLNNVKAIPRKYSDILRTLCNPSIFRTLIYSKPWQYAEPDAYAEEPWHIQNRGIFRTLGYSEPCQTSMMEHCAKIVKQIVAFANYNYFCNISYSRSLLFTI